MATDETRKLFESLIKDRKHLGKEKPNNVTEKQNKMVENLERSFTKDDPLVEGNIYNGEVEKNLKNLRNSENGKGKENKDTETFVQLENDDTEVDAESIKLLKRKRNKRIKNLSPSSGGRSSKSHREMKARTLQFSQYDTDGLDYPRVPLPDNCNEPYVRFDIAQSKTSRPPRFSPAEIKLKKARKLQSENTPASVRCEISTKEKHRSLGRLDSTIESIVEKSELKSDSERKLRFLDEDCTQHGRRRASKKNIYEESMDGSAITSQLSSENDFNKYALNYKSIPKKQFLKQSSSKKKALKKSEQIKSQANLPIKITVEDVNSLVNVFKTIWSKHSTEIVAEDCQPGPVKITLENVDSTANIRKILWKREKDFSCKVNLTKTKAEQPSEMITTVWKADSREFLKKQFDFPKIILENVDSEPNVRRTLWEGYSRPIKIVLENVDSEPNVYKTIWESLSKEFFDDQIRGSESERWKEQSDLMLSKSFTSVEKILFSCEASDSISSQYSSDDYKKKFWRDFWLKAGVEISLSCLDTSYIENTDDMPKKPVRRKKNEVKFEKNDNLKKFEQKISEEEAMPVKKVRGPRKKRRPELNESTTVIETNEISRPVPTPRKSQENIPISTTHDGADQEATPKVTVRKTRRRKKRAPSAQTSSDGAQENVEVATAVETSASNQAASMQEEFRDDSTILGVTVHYCDHLRADLRYVAHPLVKVAVVDPLTGKNLSKFDSSRHVSSFYETDSVGYILPLMTQPYDFKQNRSLLPRWEEILVFNESFSRLTQPGTEPTATKPILFFVIRDFITMAKANNKKGGPDKGWYNIAWAFLKLINANNEPNVGRKMRLQLFYPPRSRNANQDPNIEVAHDWWLNHPRQKYPSTLYVTVKAVVPPAGIGPAPRSMFAMQPEEGVLTYNEMRQSLEQAETSQRSDAEEDEHALMQLWSRVPGQTCKIPNAPFLRFWGGSEGTFTLRFSHKGIRLAAACRHESTYPISLFSIPGGKEIGVITGHQQLVYSLQWSNNDRYLLSASADGTAQVWDMERREKPVQTLPHPCYVYTASYHPIAQHIIATGGYDSILRVWNIASVTSQLTQELNGHKAIINSIIFDQTGLTMYSADGAGVIICWHSKANGKAKKNAKTNWAIKTRIANNDILGTCINSMCLHTHNNKILVHCRDSSVYILDTRIHSLRKFTGLINNRQYARSCLTPCGTFIFSGSEDGCIYVWNVEAGDQVAIYNELGYTSAVHDIVYHPHDHMIACCSYAPNQSILLYKFNSTVATMEAGYRAGPRELLDSKKNITLDADIDSQIEASKSAVKLNRIKQKLDSVLSDTESLPEGNHYINVMNDSPDEKTESLIFEARNPVLPSVQRERGQLITPIKPPRSANQSPRANMSYDPLSTWGSTFDSTTQGESFLEPSYLSPHASAEARALAQQYSRSGRLPDSAAQWRPNVASVGGSPYREQSSGIPPDVSFSIDKEGNRSLSVTSTPRAQQQSVVVVLYDYPANRSDELSIFRGDVIRVFYKDSANWWFGERTNDGKQGYFPSNYVQEQESTSTMDKSTEQSELFGVPESSSTKKIHALKMPGGRLQFYSQSESEADDERLSTSSRQRRQDARMKPVTENIASTAHGVSQPPSSLAKDETLPKSILHKSSPRPKILVQAPSMENTTPKEVSFADEPKQVPFQKSKTNLIAAIASAIESTGVQLDQQPVRSESLREKPKQKKKLEAKEKPVRSASVRQVKSQSIADTKEKSVTSRSTTKEPQQIQKPTVSTPVFGVLKSVQALMREHEPETTFSKSVLGGHEMETPKMQPRNKSNEDFQPSVHSTAVKNMNTRPTSSSESSFIKKSRPLPKLRKLPEDSIPMIEMTGSKGGRGSPNGRTNLAFDASP